MLRRPRIKASANLSNIKRKPKQEQNIENVNKSAEEEIQKLSAISETEQNNCDIVEEKDEVGKFEKDEIDEKTNQFKLPANVERTTSISDANYIDDVFYSDFEENCKQMDLQNSPMSPSKQQARQRIKPTPVFGNRRNSLVNSPSAHNSLSEENVANLSPINTSINESIGSPLRRERYYSGSSTVSTPQSNLHKNSPTVAVGRTRTESCCSNFSESPGGKARKLDDNGHRTVARRDYEARFGNGVPDKSTFKMFDLIYYNPATNPMIQKTINMPQLKNEKDDIKVDIKEDIKNIEIENDVKKNNDAAVAMPVPQLKLNSKGELILDDKSLEIETTAEQEARKTLANSTLIYLDENTGMNGFYKRQKRTKEWPNSETIKFYRCLQTIGTDFSMMCQLFPNRTRRDLKLKFKKEERCNGNLINKALLHPKIFNIEELKIQLEEEEKMREEMDKKWKELKAKNCRTIKRVHVQTSAGARALLNGDDIYNNEDVIKQNYKITKKKVAKKTKITDENNDDVGAAKARSRQQKTNKTKTIKKENTDIKTEIYDIDTDMMPINKIDNTELEENLNEILLNENYEATNPIASDGNVHLNTLINMDNGKLIAVPSKINEIMPEKNNIETESTELSENDIQHILQELSDGSLVLVSTLDPDNADNVLNEIFMLNKETGELYDKPLDIPEEVVQCILAVMS